MQNRERIVILRAYRPFLAYLTVYKADNFRDKADQLIWIRNICRALGVTLLITIYLCPFLAAELLVFIESNFNLKTVGLEFSHFICGCPTIAVHVLLIWKSNNIIATLDYLHGIVKDRKLTLCSFVC